MVAIFRGRCERLVAQGGFALGVFGHVHRAHCAPGDRYANAGALQGERLEYLELDEAGPRLGALGAADLEDG
jgi:hypothetical protein